MTLTLTLTDCSLENRRHTHIVRNGSLSDKVVPLDILFQILNLEVHPNCIIGLEVTAIMFESVEQKVKITPHIVSAEIVT